MFMILQSKDKETKGGLFVFGIKYEKQRFKQSSQRGVNLPVKKKSKFFQLDKYFVLNL